MGISPTQEQKPYLRREMTVEGDFGNGVVLRMLFTIHPWFRTDSTIHPSCYTIPSGTLRYEPPVEAEGAPRYAPK
jgi:hypothetical protein